MQAADLPLTAWDNFYVIVGSSAGALTGLQFVVITLLAAARGVQRSTRTIDAFATPTIVHFCGVLLVSAILSAPWGQLASAAIALGCVGVTGIVYTAIVIKRTRAQTVYTPVLEDWIWYAALPLLAYAALLIGSIFLGPGHHTTPSLFAIASITLLILFIGIHNAWDTVVYITTDILPQSERAGDPPQSA
jgi:hypothetical protein